jgi:formylglycine-generating enzyme required for sulfatase activity
LNHPVQQTSWYHAVAFCNKLSLAEGLVPVYDVTVNGTPVDWNALTYADIPDQTDSDWNGVTATWTNNGYRLPTEMEWMWAAMGATSGSGFSGTVYLTGYGKRFAGSDSILANGTGGTKVIEDCAVFGWNLGETGRTTTNGTSPAGSKANGANELGLYDMSGNVWEWCWDWYASYPGTMDPDYRGADTGTERVVRGGDWCNYATNCRVAQRNDYLPATRHHGVGFRVVRP